MKWSRNILAEVVVHAFNSTFGGKEEDICEYDTSLVHVTRSCLKQNQTKPNPKAKPKQEYFRMSEKQQPTVIPDPDVRII